MKNLKTPRDSRRDAGFTLLELAIVLCVIGILSAILVPSVVDIVSRAKQTAALQNCRSYYEELAVYSLDEPDLAIEDYIYVSGDYAYVMDKGALKESEEYTVKDGELFLKEDGSAAEDISPVELPEELLRDAVTVYEKVDPSKEDASGLPYDEAAEEEALAACTDVLTRSSLKVAFQAGAVFVYGNFAYDYNGKSLTLSSKTARDGELSDAAAYGLTEFDFSTVGFDAGEVRVYVPLAWSLRVL